MASPRTFYPLWVLSIAMSAVACGPTASGTGDGDDGGSSQRADAASCQQVEPIDFVQPPPPSLMLMVDRSGSMGQPLDGGDDKWSIMQAALARITADYDSAIDFGLTLFPTGAACNGGAVYVDIAPLSGGRVRSELARFSPAGGTPTHTTLEDARSYFAALPPSDAGRFILLATDGLPNCGDGTTRNATVDETLAALRSLATHGVNSYVLGFGGEANNAPDTLNAMAEAGGTASYFPVSSPAELDRALDDIASQVSADVCTVALQSVPDDPAKLGIFLDDEQLPRSPSHSQGWDYDAATNTVTIYGDACTNLRIGRTRAIRIEFGCEGPLVL